MRNRTLTALLAVAIGCFPGLLLAHKNGADPRHTAAPGDADQFACATAGCHTSFTTTGKGGPLNFYGGSVAATFSEGSTYTPGGDPITILVHVKDPTNTQYGFQMTARPESNASHGQAGSFTPGDGSFILCDNDSPRPTFGSSAGKCPTAGGFDPIEFVDHSTPSTSTWSFKWTPPTTDIGTVHFYLAGNAVNGNVSSDSGDHVYIADYQLMPLSACSTVTPSLTGVVTPIGFGARRDFSPGTWLEVYGANISTITAGKSWLGADFAEANAPTNLDRVTVQINGKPAFTSYENPGQVNVQAPADSANGPVQVTVTNCGKTSNAITLNEVPVAPAILAPLSFVVGGHQLIGATLTDLRTFVGVIPGIPSRGVKPGETIITYGVGFGDVTPAVAPGVIALVQNRLVAPLTVTIGGVPVPSASIGYAGLSPGYVGLYQFNLVVPDVPDGDQPITFQVGSASINQPTMYLSVKR
ncbi:MAG: choice-of-anchor V domain-containing protein [Acidobacteriota bacterium]